MKKFMVFYIAFSVIFLVMIYFFTLVQETNKRTLAVFYELGEEARLSEDFESFVKYQSIAHELIEKIDTPSYEFYVYHVIAQLDDQYLNQFTIFVVPIVDVTHATIVTDTQDATGITITTGGTDELIYSTETDPEYDKYAVSFGIKIIGLYFYAVELDESGSIDIVLDDYSGSPIFFKTYDFTFVEYDPENIGNFTLGYTQLEIEELMDLPSYVQPALIQNITIFIIVDILMGGLLNFFLKKKKL
jgi:hypothetical protein